MKDKRLNNLAYSDFLESNHWPKIIYKERGQTKLRGFHCALSDDQSFDFALYSFDLKKELRYIIKEVFELEPNKIKPSSFEIKSLQNFPDKNKWGDQIQVIKSMIKSGAINKLVLSRKVIGRYSGSISYPELIFRSLEETSYFFMILWGEDDFFLSKTPECLFKREGNSFETEALAGTMARESDGGELLKDHKELEEHNYVIDDINEKLIQFVQQIDIDENPSIYETRAANHLRSSIKGILSPDTTNIKLVKSLHPTAALGGYPSENIVSKIREIEGFDRNYYGAPILVNLNNKTECLVGIRSIRLKGEMFEVYAGAGIVYDSNAEKEWNETNIKMENFKWLFR